MQGTQSPFDRLRALLAKAEPGLDAIDLTVGTPKHAPPDFIPEVIAKHSDKFRGYPPIIGTANFQRAVHDFCDRRFQLNGFLRENGAVLPLNGSREGLFLAGATVLDLAAKNDPVFLFSNPYYQVYPAAAHVLGAMPVAVSDPEEGALPDLTQLPEELLQRVAGYYFCSPSNPRGLSATKAEWHNLFDLAERYDFRILADECYSEVYREKVGPPVGALKAAAERPGALERLFAFNSLSKRSNLAGMRVGYLAGAKGPMGVMRTLRAQIGPQVPVPLQEAAAAAYDDEVHVVENRRLYDEKYADTERILGPVFGDVVPDGGFFVWLNFGGDDEAIALDLWREVGVRTVPGSYLSALDWQGVNPGKGFIRLALVNPAEEARAALERIRTFALSRQPLGVAAEPQLTEPLNQS